VIRVELQAGATRDAVDDAAHALGLALVNIVPAAPGRPAQLVFVSPDRRVGVHLVEREGALSWAIRTEPEDAALEESWATRLSEAFP
jgi:hypothetical protein